MESAQRDKKFDTSLGRNRGPMTKIFVVKGDEIKASSKGS